jgi:hypothetical protein
MSDSVERQAEYARFMADLKLVQAQSLETLSRPLAAR